MPKLVVKNAGLMKIDFREGQSPFITNLVHRNPSISSVMSFDYPIIAVVR